MTDTVPARTLPRWAPDALVLGVALTLRLVLLAVDHVEVFAKYPNAAGRVLAGTLPADRALDFSLLYLALAVLARVIAGPAAVLVILVVQALAGAVTAWATCCIGRRLVSPAVGLIAGLLFACFRPSLVLDRVVEPESLVLLALASWVALLLRAVQRPSRASAFAAGAVLALGLGLRPSGLAPAVVALALLAWPPAGSRCWRVAAAFAAGIAVVVVPACTVVAVVTGRMPRAPMNPGVVFHVGNNPRAVGIGGAYPPLLKELEALAPPGESDYGHVVYRQLASAALGHEASRDEAAAYFRRLSTNFLRDYPANALRLEAWKLRSLLASTEHHDLEDTLMASRRLARRGVPGWGLAWPLALAVVAAGAATRRKAWPAAAFLVAGSAESLVFYVSERHRFPLAPFALLLAATSLAGMAAHVRARRAGAALAWAAVVALGVLASAIPRDVAVADERLWTSIGAAQAHRDAARAMLQHGDAAGARRRVEASLALMPFDALRFRLTGVADPWPGALALRAARVLDANDRFDLGLLRLQVGDPTGALAELEQVAAANLRPWREFRMPPGVHQQLCRAHLALGDLEAAWSECERAAVETPGEPWLLARRSALLERLGRPEAARAEAARLERYADAVTAREALGESLLEAGLAERASDELRWVTTALPQLRRAHLWRAAALSRLGRWEEGAAEYAAAMRLDSHTVVFESDVLRLADGLAAARPDDPQSRELARVLHRQVEGPPGG